MTVVNQKGFASTAVFKLLPVSITVARAVLVGYDCHQAMENESKLQCSRRLFVHPTVSSEKSYWGTAVWKILFCLCTVIL